jgi:hypothetical protein
MKRFGRIIEFFGLSAFDQSHAANHPLAFLAFAGVRQRPQRLSSPAINFRLQCLQYLGRYNPLSEAL